MKKLGVPVEPDQRGKKLHRFTARVFKPTYGHVSCRLIPTADLNTHNFFLYLQTTRLSAPHGASTPTWEMERQVWKQLFVGHQKLIG